MEPTDAGVVREDAGTMEHARIGLVVAMSNEPDGNDIVALTRDADGELDELGRFATGGMGSGAGLGSQGAIAIDEDHEYIYVVNPGSNQVSTMQIFDDHIALVDVVASGGEQPISLAVRGSRLYVLNGGGAGNVAGFDIDDGQLTPLAGSTRSLSSDKAGPAQVGVDTSGTFLVVTEKATNDILTFRIAADGTLSEAVVTTSEGMTPFGFDFSSDGVLVVSEAFGGADGASAVSSYTIRSDGRLSPVSRSIANGQSAACWVLVVSDRYAYTTNTRTDNVSGYYVDVGGALSLFEDDGVTADLGEAQAPIDMAASEDGRFIYVLNSRSDTIVGYEVRDDGTLSQVGSDIDVPAMTVGLAAF